MIHFFYSKRVNPIRLLILLMMILPSVQAKTFTYHHQKGDQFRFLSTVNQEAGFIDEPLEQLQIINRISFTVTDVNADGSGYLKGEMQSSEQRHGQISSLWELGYEVAYWRELSGRNRVAPHLYTPAVRHAPAFPNRNLEIGDRWIHPGEEVLDLRKSLGLNKPYVVPFTGEYHYTGTMEKDGKTYHAIELSYKWQTSIAEALRLNHRRQGINAPKHIQASFQQIIYWDDDLHQPAWYEEQYRYLFTMEDGSTYVMQGDANAYLLEATPMNKEDITQSLNEEIKRLGLDNVSVKQEEDGITLVVENIQFNANSAYLLDSEIEKLRMIAKILVLYSDRDLEISGHTAKSVSESAAQRLSEQRALSVANFFIEEGVRPKERIITRGYGSRKPIATNETQEGMAKNRRVEIKILEN
ncbi:OmpA family protein [Entomospira entomophila]|uniref:OmpA family protein n=1 Tax=Entomospira entomophila TaxID=2719988 RepID=A0A968GDR9_9SPIO|nr:OmpA family protein [Entomospira entomophilus]NIZ40564.1 OmpA family protein [Entomospira entomophilus]WDI36122.1 OmpA family protein [Entomospira entomophilus]